MVSLLKNIIVSLFHWVNLSFKIKGGEKISFPFCMLISDIFLSEISKYGFLLRLHRKITTIDKNITKFYGEEVDRRFFGKEFVFFLIYFPIGFIFGLIKKNIRYIFIFGVFIGDLQIFGVNHTLKQKKGQKVFKKILIVLFFSQILYFLTISFYYKLFIFCIVIYGNGKEYFKDMKEKKEHSFYFKDNFKGGIIYGLRSLLGFFVNDDELIRLGNSLMEESNKGGFTKGRFLYIRYYALESFFGKKEIQINIRKLKKKLGKTHP